MKKGDRVMWAGYAVQKECDYWLGLGRGPMKSEAKKKMERVSAQRGTVVEVGKTKQGYDTVTVKMDDEASVHNALPYWFEVVSSNCPPMEPQHKGNKQ